ncbi:hypothetical protein BOTBODRAFT_34747 [Botryobasidium botryosum FD-172 SS1]|uniref:Cleavage/polyadenylation specificity factor A subunit N-terminal domain-containing protein n=1 Tax=Botryobasidium botryosum (strain FD-172 SS1) TaxID=930990 RepID=A0A067M974_BOTB1|nr:hypothetical protein BOTBODRAFT_34747 [Botryobasidium botryosum FD-172 SS1]
MAPSFSSMTYRHELTQQTETRLTKGTFGSLITGYACPYIVTCDSFGQASNVWVIQPGEGESLRLLTSLQPPIPASVTRIWAVYLSSSNVLVVGFNDPKREIGIMRPYKLDTGEALRSLELPGVFMAVHPSFRLVSGDTIAADVASGDRRVPRVVVSTIVDEGLVEVNRFKTDLSTEAPSLENLTALHLNGEGALLTSSTSIPSKILDLTLHGPSSTARISLSPSFESDSLEPTAVVTLSSTSIALAIVEGESEYDYDSRLNKSTIHRISHTPLSSEWAAPVTYKVDELTHHPSLGMLVALGRHHGGEDVGWRNALTFIDEQSGKVIKTEYFRNPTQSTVAAIRCTSTDDFVAVYTTGRIYTSPLKSILDEGLPAGSDGRLLVEQTPPMRPEPYNASARKAGDQWQWVDHAFVGPKTVVLFATRGPDFFALRW